MPTVYKVLGQQAPNATTPATLYTVPSATEAIISTITVCNRGSTLGTFRVSVRPNGAALANQHYLVFDAEVGPNQTLALTLGVTLDATDVLEVYASTGNFSFNAFGSEVS